MAPELLMIRPSYCFRSLTNAQYSVETLQLLRSCDNMKNKTLKKIWTVFITLPPPPELSFSCNVPQALALMADEGTWSPSALVAYSQASCRRSAHLLPKPKNNPAVSPSLRKGCWTPVSNWFASPQKFSQFLPFPLYQLPKLGKLTAVWNKPGIQPMLNFKPAKTGSK